jgi:hypothetical protein
MLRPKNEGLKLESRDAQKGREATGEDNVYDDNYCQKDSCERLRFVVWC